MSLNDASSSGRTEAKAGVSVSVDTHGIAHLTLTRKDQVNAIDHSLAAGLRAAVSDLCGRRDLRAILMSGRGRAFSVGGDLKSFAHEGPNAPRYVRGIITDLHAAINQLVDAPAPVICAVHGSAAGAGLGLALSADIVIAAEDAKFLMAYTAAGVTPDGGTTWILPRLVGLHRALDLTLRNRMLNAHEARNLGLVAEVCPPDALSAHANAIAQEMARGPTDAFVQARRLLRQSFHTALNQQLDDEGDTVVRAFTQPDGQEGARAFAERRPAKFTGATIRGKGEA